MINDCSIDTRTSDPLGACAYNLAARDDGNVSRPAADINNRRTSRVISADAGAKRCSQAFFDHAHAPDTRMLGRGQQSAPFDWRNVRKNAHQRTAAEMRYATAGLVHQIGQHLPGSFEVSHYAVLQWSDHRHATRLTSVLLLRFIANIDHFSR